MIRRFFVLVLFILAAVPDLSSDPELSLAVQRNHERLKNKNMKRHSLCKTVLASLLELYRQQINPEAKMISWKKVKILNFPGNLHEKSSDLWTINDLKAIESALPEICFQKEQKDSKKTSSTSFSSSSTVFEAAKPTLKRKAQSKYSPIIQAARITRRNAADFEEFSLPTNMPSREIRNLLKDNEAFKKQCFENEQLDDITALDCYFADEEDSLISVEDLLVSEDFDPNFDEMTQSKERDAINDETAQTDRHLETFDISQMVWT